MTRYPNTTFTIYKLVNKTTGKTYTGVTSNYRNRIIQHFSSLQYNYHSNSELQSDFNKGHIIEPLIICKGKWRDKKIKEIANIDKNTYNIRFVKSHPIGTRKRIKLSLSTIHAKATAA